MSDAIDYIELQKSKAIQYMVAQILDESPDNTPYELVEKAILRGMEYQHNIEVATRASEGFKDAHNHRDEWSGYHPSNLELQIDENGLPYYGITRNIMEN